jgi:NAD(P)-dependent dehydrogenase (short-subunit alcohol dehydrogenase family)
MAVYSATKFGVRALTEALDAEWARRRHQGGQRSMPSFIDTPLLAHAPNRGHQRPGSASRVRDAGLEITPVGEVADAGMEGRPRQGDLHTRVGKTAHRLAFASALDAGPPAQDDAFEPEAAGGLIPASERTERDGL